MRIAGSVEIRNPPDDPRGPTEVRDLLAVWSIARVWQVARREAVIIIARRVDRVEQVLMRDDIRSADDEDVVWTVAGPHRVNRRLVLTRILWIEHRRCTQPLHRRAVVQCDQTRGDATVDVRFDQRVDRLTHTPVVLQILCSQRTAIGDDDFADLRHRRR